jgi:hypothetical protein
VDASAASAEPRALTPFSAAGGLVEVDAGRLYRRPACLEFFGTALFKLWRRVAR